jgi:hypothetical protein
MLMLIAMFLWAAGSLMAQISERDAPFRRPNPRPLRTAQRSHCAGRKSRRCRNLAIAIAQIRTGSPRSKLLVELRGARGRPSAGRSRKVARCRGIADGELVPAGTEYDERRVLEEQFRPRLGRAQQPGPGMVFDPVLHGVEGDVQLVAVVHVLAEDERDLVDELLVGGAVGEEYAESEMLGADCVFGEG